MSKQVLFRPAAETKSYLRLALVGVSGSGKTWSSLELAEHLADGGKIAVVDSEHGSSAKYADRFQFDILALDNFHPQNYIDAIEAAAAAGYKVIILDSLSHAWSGEGGLLEVVDNIAARSASKNSFSAWKDATPIHHKMIDTILGAEIHIIATMRVKTEYIIEENERGKKVPRKVGLAPDQRAGLEYEFDIVGDLGVDGKLVISKTRCHELTDQVYPRPDETFYTAVATWAKRNNGNPYATQAQFDEYERLRQEYKKLSGEERKPAKPDATAAVMDKAIASIQRLIADGKELGFGNDAQAPAETPEPPAAPPPAATGNPAINEAEHRAAISRLRKAGKKLYGKEDWEDKVALAFSKPPRQMTDAEMIATAAALEAMIAREAEKAATPPPPAPDPASAWDDDDDDEGGDDSTPPAPETAPEPAPPAAPPKTAAKKDAHEMTSPQRRKVFAIADKLWDNVRASKGVHIVLDELKLPPLSELTKADANKLIDRLTAIEKNLLPLPEIPDANGELPRTPPAASKAPEIHKADPAPAGDDNDWGEDPFADE